MAASFLLPATCALLVAVAIADNNPPQIQAMPAGELQGLVELMSSLLGDPSWSDPHPHPCTDTPWPGLQCELLPQLQDGLLHVTKLHFGPDVASPACKPGAKLSPFSLYKLPYLKSLSLLSCFHDPVLLPPALFTNASSLEQLVIRSNPGLGGVVPSTLSQLHSLRVLSLSQNGFHGEIPPELGVLAKLEQLDLSYNFLTGEIPVQLGWMPSLAILDLSWNQLQGKLPPSIGNLHALQKIDLSYNRFTGTVPQELGTLRDLVLLDLGHNAFTGPIPDSLARLHQLQYLLVESNPIGTPVPLFLASLKNLLVLGLSNCSLSGPLPQYLGSLASLTALSLDRNSLNGSIPDNLGTLQHLGQLNLSQNRLTGEIGLPCEFVTRLGSRLDVRDNDRLCIDHNKYKNLSSYVEAPPCMDAAAAVGGGRGSSAGALSNSGFSVRTMTRFIVRSAVSLLVICIVIL